MKLIHIHGVWPLYTNTFLLITAAGHAVVVDPAAEAETYLAQLKENNATLTDIFLTHGHYDHVGSVAALKKATGAKVHMDLADAKGDQMYPLTPDLIDAPWPAGNSEYQVDELTFRIWAHTGPHPRRCGHRLRRPAVQRRYPVCGQLRPCGPARRQPGGDATQPCSGGGPAPAG